MLLHMVCRTIEYYRALALADGDEEAHADKLQAALEVCWWSARTLYSFYSLSRLHWF